MAFEIQRTVRCDGKVFNAGTDGALWRFKVAVPVGGAVLMWGSGMISTLDPPVMTHGFATGVGYGPDLMLANAGLSVDEIRPQQPFYWFAALQIPPAHPDLFWWFRARTPGRITAAYLTLSYGTDPAAPQTEVIPP